MQSGPIQQPNKTSTSVQAMFQEAMVLHQHGQLLPAQLLYQNVLLKQPRHADALHLSGLIALQFKEYQKAADLIAKAIKANPGNAVYYLNQGIALKELRQFVAAVSSYDKAIALQPNYAAAYYSRGNALKDLKRLNDAVVSYGKAIALQPNDVLAHSNRGLALQELNQLDDAVASFDKAISIDPGFAEGYLNKSIALRVLMRLDEALASNDKAIALQPQNAVAHSNRGLVLQELNQLDAAVMSFDKAISIDPEFADSYFNKSLALLLGGDFAKGWILYEWRWKRQLVISKTRQFAQPRWTGEQSLVGKVILLYSEQGLGDSLQFCRYARSVAALGARVIMEVPQSLIGVLQRLDGVHDLIAAGTEIPNFDYQCPLLSLPAAFKTNTGNIVDANGYLRTDTATVAKWSEFLGKKTKTRVGIVWSGNTAHSNDHNRSLTLAQMLAQIPIEAEIVSLQKELRTVDQATLEGNPRLRHFGENLHDFSDTAALCSLMDVVISVDTSVAHLSAALGLRTWILLPFSPDWRWLLNRTDSPWYTSVTLYRQDAPGDWTGAFEMLNKNLRDLTLID